MSKIRSGACLRTILVCFMESDIERREGENSRQPPNTSQQNDLL